MLKKLRRRFILVTMALVSVSLLVMFGAICVLTYRTGRGQINQAINSALHNVGMDNEKNSGNAPEPSQNDTEHAPSEGGDSSSVDSSQEGTKPPKEDVRLPKIGGNDEFSYVYTITVIVLPDGTILREDVFGADIEESVLNEAVQKALQSSKKQGELRSLHLSWKSVDIPEGGTKIVFASTDHLIRILKSTALICGIVSLGSLLLFFGVSWLLSGIAIKPTAEAWKKQKQFVADASHDLKTPLTVILANADILRSQPQETVSSQMQWIEGTAEEAERMKKLVNQLLELAKSEDMQDSLVLSPLSVSDLAETAVLQFEPVAFERKILIDSDIAPNVILSCNEDSIVRVFHILLDNAIKYSPNGEKVTVRLEQHGTGAVFTVHNGGNPISAEDLPHLFERFYRADKARTVGGFGLGLSIAKNLVESLRGKISVTSSAEAGTTFTVRL